MGIVQPATVVLSVVVSLGMTFLAPACGPAKPTGEAPVATGQTASPTPEVSSTPSVAPSVAAPAEMAPAAGSASASAGPVAEARGGFVHDCEKRRSQLSCGGCAFSGPDDPNRPTSSKPCVRVNGGKTERCDTLCCTGCMRD
jgi:hypothetical protein